MKWHDDLVEKLKDALKQFIVEKPRICVPYHPDIFLDKNGQKIIIEVETVRSHCKILEDILFSSIAKVDKLIIVFSTKAERGKTSEKRGERRKKETENLYELLNSYFGLASIKLVKPEIHVINDVNDEKLAQIVQELSQ